MTSLLAGAHRTRHTPHRRPAVVVAAAALVLTLLASAEPAGATVSSINGYRDGAGRPPVDHHDGLASLASQHAQAMADEGRLFHSSDLGGRVSSVGVDWNAVAENVGVGASMDEVNEAFMESSSHRANILGDFTLAGVGAVTGSDGQVWVTQVFARVPAGEPPPPPPPPAPPPPEGHDTDPVEERVTTARASRSRAASPPATPAAPVPDARLSGFTAGVLAAPALGRWREGYFLFDADGGVFAHDGAEFSGSLAGTPLASPVVAGASTPRGDGYWLAASDGGVFAVGGARFRGSATGTGLAADIVGIAPARGQGYWLVGEDGGVFAYGAAEYYGGLGDTSLNAPVAGAAAARSGKGYWLVGEDGGVFAFGDASYYGGLSETQLNRPVTGMAPTVTGKGYWLVTADGGVFAFGDANHAGGLAGKELDHPIRAIVPERTGSGYHLMSTAGEVFSFGRRAAKTSARGYSVPAPVFIR